MCAKMRMKDLHSKISITVDVILVKIISSYTISTATYTVKAQQRETIYSKLKNVATRRSRNHITWP